MTESITTRLLNKSQLTEQEKNRLVGEICAEYERLRYNGSEKQVMRIYHSDRTGAEDHYIYEKTRNYFRCGMGFASNLQIGYLATLGEVLRENAE